MQMFTIYHKKNGHIWVSMKDVKFGMGVKNISDLVLKEIFGICETRNPTEEQAKEYNIQRSEQLCNKNRH